MRRLSNTIRNKLVEHRKQVESFKKYQYAFEHICRYPKRDGKLCDKQVEKGLCKVHTKCHNRLNERITSSIPALPPDISKIVAGYASLV